MMSRKDYNATAEIINKFFDVIADDERFDDIADMNGIIHDNLIDEFIKMFSADNPNFNPDIFWEKCTR